MTSREFGYTKQNTKYLNSQMTENNDEFFFKKIEKSIDANNKFGFDWTVFE